MIDIDRLKDAIDDYAAVSAQAPDSEAQDTAARRIANLVIIGGLGPELLRLREFAAWLVSLDNSEGPGADARRTVTLNQIIQQARAALGRKS